MPWLGLAYYQAYATLRCKEGLLHEMGILSDQGIADVRHYAPLHYLPFVVRSRSLMCKPSLAAAGFNPTHYRSMSYGQDVARGFGGYSHLTLDHKPRILRAKLAAGFPHV